MGLRIPLGKSLSRLELSHTTPPYFYNYIFSGAPKWARSVDNRSKCENSILRKRVYSFKHSGNSRGTHRGPENMCVFWQSGLKMSDFGCVSHDQAPNFVKHLYGLVRAGYSSHRANSWWRWGTTSLPSIPIALCWFGLELMKTTCLKPARKHSEARFVIS